MSTQNSTTAIFGDFGKGLQNLLEEAISVKSKELAEREKIISEREAKIDHILKENEKTKGRVILQVGSVVYHTTTNTLLKIKDSFFHGLLNPEFQSDKSALFIDRDGEVFQYILEYLIYGTLISVIDNELLQKLLVDADYYLLPDLVRQLKVSKEQKEKQQQQQLQEQVQLQQQLKQLQQQLQEQKQQHQLQEEKQLQLQQQQLQELKQLQQQKDKIFLKLRSTATASNGSYINWNVATMVPDSHFKHNGSTTIKIKQAGLYQIFVQYVCTCSTNGQGSANIDLYVSGNVVSRVYHGQTDNYYQSRGLMEILPLKFNDTIMVMYCSNAGGVADQLANSMTILLLTEGDGEREVRTPSELSIPSYSVVLPSRGRGYRPPVGL